MRKKRKGLYNKINTYIKKHFLKNNYKSILNILLITGIVLSVFGIISFIYIITNPVYIHASFKLDKDLAEKFGVFFGGFIGTIFSIITAILILYTFINQKIETKKQQAETHFFKMLDYHNDNVKNISVKHIDQSKKNEIANGRRAFVIFKYQISKLLEIIEKIKTDLQIELQQEDIIDIAYISFYYGIDEEWKSFLKERLIKYPKGIEISTKLLEEKEKWYQSLRIGRTNQTNLSSYYRNMYNAIKFIDKEKSLSLEEKKKYIKIYRAQLSNPELYVLFFNVTSRFGKKWKENNYIMKYEFIKNLPNNYCGKYDYKKIFPMTYEEDELN